MARVELHGLQEGPLPRQAPVSLIWHPDQPQVQSAASSSSSVTPQQASPTQAAVSITSVEVRPVGHPEEQTPVRFPEAHATGKKLPQEQEAAPRTARNAETREASHVCSAQSCQAQGPRPLLGRLLPRYSSCTWGLNPPPCSWHPQIPGSPFRAHHGCHRDPRARPIRDTGVLCSHGTEIPRRRPVCCSGNCPAPKTLAEMVVLAETSRRLPGAAGQRPAIVPDWPGGAVVITRQTFHLVHRCARASCLPSAPVLTGREPCLP